MKKKLYIITGASRGIGHALAAALLSEGHHLICISRSGMEDLRQVMTQNQGSIRIVHADLSDLQEASELIPSILTDIHPQDFSELNLINNAAMLEPVAACGTGDDTMTLAHMRINLLAPMILTSSLIRITKDWTIPRTGLNISSGAGSSPYYGWSAYCTSKSGLDMFTRCVGLEQQHTPHGLRILSVAPGVVDTQLQQIIRNADPAHFPDRERFIRLKEKGTLRQPSEVAADLIRILERTNLPNGSVLDLRDLDT